MSPDIRDVLKNAAAKPTSSPDVHSLWHRGARLRWARRAMASGMVVALGLGTWAGASALGDDDGSVGPAPAGAEGLCELLDEYQPTPEMAIFLRDGVTRAEIAELQEAVQAAPGVLEVTHFSKREAYEEFKKHYEDQPEFYEKLPPSALPASLRVVADDPDRLPELAAAFRNAPGVDEIRYGGQIVERLRRSCNDPELRQVLERLCDIPETGEWAPVFSRYCDEL